MKLLNCTGCVWWHNWAQTLQCMHVLCRWIHHTMPHSRLVQLIYPSKPQGMILNGQIVGGLTAYSADAFSTLVRISLLTTKLNETLPTEFPLWFVTWHSVKVSFWTVAPCSNPTWVLKSSNKTQGRYLSEFEPNTNWLQVKYPTWRGSSLFSGFFLCLLPLWTLGSNPTSDGSLACRLGFQSLPDWNGFLMLFSSHI